jgi:beta-lactam-binding protein with PASTA domain
VLAALSALGVLAVVALAAGLYLNNQPDKVDVPRVIGKAQNVAQQELEAVGLKLTPGAPVTAGCTNFGKIVKQNPKDGIRVERGSAVTVQVCQGPKTVTIPTDLEGFTKDAAETRLKNLDLDVQFKPVDSDKPVDIVVRVPNEGDKVNVGTLVVVEISKGNKKEVPDVVGESQETAESILRRAGFKVKVKAGDVSADRAGEVADQDPNGRQLAQTGSTVTITVLQPEPEPTATETTSPTPPPNQ